MNGKSCSSGRAGVHTASTAVVRGQLSRKADALRYALCHSPSVISIRLLFLTIQTLASWRRGERLFFALSAER
jgi:hypothetical protein